MSLKTIDMIVVVSDVHLAERADDPQTRKDDAEFLEFLDYIASDLLKNGGELVLLGDIIDLWRRDFIKAMLPNLPKFQAHKFSA